MSLQNRTTAVQGEYVRLYCRFIQDGILFDPMTPPTVFITDNSYYQESSSSSSFSSSSSRSSQSWAWDSSTSSFSSSMSSDNNPGIGFGPFVAQKENTGVWFVDWLVPDNLPVGMYFDVWKYQWTLDIKSKTEIFEINVSKFDTIINSNSPALVSRVGDIVYGMVNDLANNFIYEAMHIPIYWEQGYRVGNRKTFNFAYKNWNQDPKPIVRINQRIYPAGWMPNYDGSIFFEKNLDPEDMVYAQYNFRYFSDEEILDFLNMGLYAMNATPPASENYTNINSAPFIWRFGIILYAAIRAMQRLVFGLNFQERAIIFAEKPELVQNAINNFKQLYSDYNALWLEVKKDVKTLKLPGIGQISVPEYTLPGGRSRWFRYMYKTGV